jgi:transcriptional regulator with XRE-family HTH domain
MQREVFMGRVGDEIARMRTARGMTQKQLANQAGVAEVYIADVESGRRVMQDQLASRISKLLGGNFGSDLPDYVEPASGGKTSATRPAPTAQNAARPSARSAEPASQLVYSTQPEVSPKAGAETANSSWSDAFGQMLKEVPVFDAAMLVKTGNRTMAVLNGKVEEQPKDKVFWLQAEDNEMIGYRMQRTDMVFGVQASVLADDGFYLLEVGGRRLMRHLKKEPGGMVQITCHKGAPIRETMSLAMVKILGRLLRVEIRLP